MGVHSQGTPLNIAQRKKGVSGVNVTSDNLASLLPPVSPSGVRSALALAPFAPTRVTGISATAIPANNLRGTATFVAATTVAVVFGVAELNATYFVALGGVPEGNSWVDPTSKLTTGFTIHCSAVSSSATDWILIR